MNREFFYNTYYTMVSALGYFRTYLFHAFNLVSFKGKLGSECVFIVSIKAET